MEPETGIRYTDASVDITRDQVDHYFGEFHCSCVAITKKVAKVSNSALVTTACKYYVWHLFQFVERILVACNGLVYSSVLIIYFITYWQGKYINYFAREHRVEMFD